MEIDFRELAMDTFWTIVVVLVVLWLVGFFALPGVGSLIHLLLVIAVIVVVYRLVTGRNVVTGR
jgi:multisubunit Na+/H+ antiporter MnhF subunit